ncbi:MAG: AMP-binding protein, partial [Caldimonas sp.]
MTELHGAHGDDPRDPAGETLPRLLRRRAAEHPARDFLRAKRHGVWAALGWADALARVEALARAMMTRGVGTGDVVAVIGENRPEAYLVQYAALCTGAAATHLYPDASAAELGYVLQHSGARLLFAEDQEQVDKFLDTGAAGAGVAAGGYHDHRGLWPNPHPLRRSFAGF